MPIELELKHFLAERLPDIIREDYGTEGDDFHLEWKIEPFKGMRVRPMEMEHIVGLVEEQVPSESDYFKALENEWILDQRAIPFNYWLVHLIWQTRTLALREVLGKKG